MAEYKNSLSKNTIPTNLEIKSLLQAFQSGKLDIAEKLALSMTKKFPKYELGWKLLGVLMIMSGRLCEGLNINQKLVSLFPKDYEAHYNLGINLFKLKKLNEARRSFEKSIELKSNYAEAYFNLGITLEELSKFQQAEASFKKAIESRSNYIEAYNNLGIILRKLGKLSEAEMNFKRAIELNANYAEAYNNLGNLLQILERFDESEKNLKKTLGLMPNFAEAHNNLGNLLEAMGKLNESEVSYRKALELKPNLAEAHNNLGIILKKTGRLDEAEISFNKAIKLKPNYAEAKFNLSYVHNLKGNLKKGLRLYEWRYDHNRKEPTTRAPKKNLIWNGTESLKGKKFLVYEEQGLGDIIQFCRYLLLLENENAHVIFKVKTSMHSLLKTLSNKIIYTDKIPENIIFDFESPLLSLPYLFKTEIKTIPKFTPYLKADARKASEWSKKFNPGRFKVGICWQGKNIKIDKGRSFPLSCFKEISKIDNLDLISLYKGENESDLERIDFRVMTLGPDFDNENNAFIDTAAVIINCDLIITSDTSIAHLAGALGRPVWVALNYVPDWRWMLNRIDSPWYPTMRLYRQNNLNDWDFVFNKITKDLLEVVKNNSLNNYIN